MIKRYIVLLIFSYFVFDCGYSQSYEIIYHKKYFETRDLRIGAKQKLPLTLEQINRINMISNSRITVSRLRILKERSVFRFMEDRILEEHKKWTRPVPPEQLDIGHFHKNRETNQFYVINGRVPKNKIVEENLSSLNDWDLIENDTIINKMYCKKAVNSVDKVVAWYSPEIPLSEGPLQYAGLPGLIILLIDNEKEYFFKFVQFETRELNEREFEIPQIDKKLTLLDFKNILSRPVTY